MELTTFLLRCFVIIIIPLRIRGGKIDDYENLIYGQINSSLEYTFPENAYEYKPTEENDIDFGTFDFIVIGSGASGAVVASRLSEITGWRVLLLEAGSFGNVLTDIPNMLLSFHFSKFNWGYRSIPQTTSCLDMPDKRCYYHRGKGVGGSTLLNGLIYVRGSRVHFDNWGKENPGWSYNDVYPYFLKSENFKKTDLDAVVDEKYHRTGGLLDVEFRVPRHPLVNNFLQANQEQNYEVRDVNGEESVGVGVAQLMINNGKREDSGTAFIKPFYHRSNLNISTDSYVVKILINNKTKTAKGVRFAHHNKYYVAKAKREVILSAGSIGSAQILMLSGIGPKNHLKEVNIPVIKNLEVGTKLRDHACFRGLYFDANYTRNNKSIREYVKEYMKGKGTFTVPNENDGVGYYQSSFSTEPNDPDLELIFLPIDGFYKYIQQRLKSAKEKLWLTLDQIRGFGVNIVIQKTRSTGTIRLNSSDPFDYPVIDSRFLSDPENIDIETLYEGIQVVLNLTLHTEAFQKINTTLYRQKLPACDDKPYMSKSYWLCALRYFTWNIFHPVGTCPMGPNPNKGAVVDAKAKVHGIKKLRVVDASIYPSAISGHPHGQCVMIGEKISDMIKKEHLKL